MVLFLDERYGPIFLLSCDFSDDFQLCNTNVVVAAAEMTTLCCNIRLFLADGLHFTEQFLVQSKYLLKIVFTLD